MPTIKIYSKEQVDALISSAGGLPDPTSASAGDVLTLDSNKDPAWVAPSGGGGHTVTTTTFGNLRTFLNGLPAGTNFIFRMHKNSTKSYTVYGYGNTDMKSTIVNGDILITGTATFVTGSGTSGRYVGWLESLGVTSGSETITGRYMTVAGASAGTEFTTLYGTSAFQTESVTVEYWTD